MPFRTRAKSPLHLDKVSHYSNTADVGGRDYWRATQQARVRWWRDRLFWVALPFVVVYAVIVFVQWP